MLDLRVAPRDLAAGVASEIFDLDDLLPEISLSERLDDIAVPQNHRRGHRAAGRRASGPHRRHEFVAGQDHALARAAYPVADGRPPQIARLGTVEGGAAGSIVAGEQGQLAMRRPSLCMRDRKSTRLNSRH